MGCQSEVIIGDNLTFGIACHDPDTGILTDADSAPAYRIYEDETAVPILTGTMAKLDDVNTTGFYTELIACTAGNGFENGKTYTIYITATVDADQGGITYAFKAKSDGLSTQEKTDVNAEIVDAINVDTYAEPGQEAPGATVSLAKKLNYLYKFLRNKITQDATTLKIYDDAGTTVDQKATVADDGSTYTRNEIGTGP